MIAFLGARAIAGVESIDGDAYARTVALGGRTGWIRVSNRPGEHALAVEASESLVAVLPALLGRLRQLFDLDARPDVIAEHLAVDARLRPLVADSPGLRVPGAFDGFELALRAVLGQQITVKAATTLASRVITTYGDSIDTPREALTRVTPPAARLAEARVDDVASLGIVRARAATIITLAREVAEGRLVLEPGADPDATIAQLVALPGIG